MSTASKTELQKQAELEKKKFQEKQQRKQAGNAIQDDQDSEMEDNGEI